MSAALEGATREYKAIEEDLSTAVDARRRLEEQLTENDAVQREFMQLRDHNTVYKLFGAVLIKQDSEEAKMNVGKRLGYIKLEITRVEGRIQTLKEKINRKKLEVVKLQGELQSKT